MQTAKGAHGGQQQLGGEALRSWLPPTSTPGFPTPLSRGFQQGLCPDHGSTLTNTWWPVKVYRLNKDQLWDTRGARHVVLPQGVAQGHVPASQNLVKRGPGKTWSAAGGNGKPRQCSCLKSPVNAAKREKATTPEDESAGQAVSNVLPGESRETAPGRTQRLG